MSTEDVFLGWYEPDDMFYRKQKLAELSQKS